MYRKTMIKYIIACLSVSCMWSSAQTLVWSEEFNYTAAPDSDVWSYDLGNSGWGNQELQNYTSDAANVRVDGTNLVITAIKQGSGNNASFSSARIKTLDKLTFKYGTIEARIQTPDLANGLWPAFWTLGNNYPSAGWPECGEIDIMEMGIYSAINDGVVNQRTGSHFHWHNGGYANYGGTVDLASPIDDTFVIYRMEWTPTQIRMFINGMPITTMNTGAIPEFNAPHFFVLNMAVGGTYTDIFNANGITANFPAEYRVDWIRLYDEGDTVLGGSSTLTPPTPGTNLLENSGFEGGTDGWDLSLSGGIAWGSSIYDHSGGYSVKIDSTGAGDWASPNLSQSFLASPGDVFNMQGYMLNPTANPISGGSFGLLKIEFLNSSGEVLDPASVDVGIAAASPYYGAESVPKLNAGSATGTWIFSEVQAAAPSDTAMVRFVVLNVNQPGNPGLMYFDDVEAVLLGASNSPPVFAYDPVIKANAVEDAAYTGQTLAGGATDPDSDPLSYNLVPGGPVWLSLTTNGVLSGTPGNADVGLNSWAVEVTDGIRGPVSATLRITVDNVNDAPVFMDNPIVMLNALESSTYSDTLAGSATDVDAGANLSYSLVPGGPAWLNMTTTGALSGTPGHGDTGLNNWIVQVSDGFAAPVTAALEITVDPLVTGLNLLTNPGFESGTTDWDPLGGGSASASMNYSQSGSNALVIDSSGAGDYASPNLSQTFSASSGDVFKVQGYMLTPFSITDGSFGLFKIEFRDSSGTVLEPALVEIGTSAGGPYFGAESTPRLDSSSTTGTWIFSEAQAEAPLNTATVGFYLLNVNPPGNSGPSMYFDDIQAILIGDPVLPVSLSPAIVDSNFQISFPTQNGVSYQMAFKSSLTNANWTPLEIIVGDGNTNSVSYPASSPAGFYVIMTP